MNLTEQFVAMTVAVLAADGKMEAEEFETIRGIANDMEFNKDEIEALIAAEIQKPRELKKIANTVKKDDRDFIMFSCIAVALSDKYLCKSEVDLLLEIATMLKLKPAEVILAIAAYVQNDRSILIEGNATLHNEDEIIIEDEDIK
ncbi:MAG: TerB family tellurite resistance protein [Bacteroidales bacterium]|nr:TerB family tellurite resistance protein [Bacteroidales bacterium]